MFVTASIVVHGADARTSVTDFVSVGDWLFVFPLCGFSLSLFCHYFVSVTTPRQLQESVTTGITHVVINTHMVVFELPGISRRLVALQGADLLAIQRNSDGQCTKSIVVRYTFTRFLFCKTRCGIKSVDTASLGSSAATMHSHATCRLNNAVLV